MFNYFKDEIMLNNVKNVMLFMVFWCIVSFGKDYIERMFRKKEVFFGF